MQEGMVGKLKQTGTAVRQAADKAGRPTITVAAAMAGLAGGLALRQRHAASHDGLTTRSMAMLHDVDAAALIGGLGKATVQLSQRSKNVARDIERVAEQAERLGKILS
jgi:putative copper export protein